MKIFNLGSGMVNCYMYKAKCGCILIDTGYPKDYSNFKSLLYKNGFDILQLKYIFVTHAHSDHVGFLKNILDYNPSVKIILHEKAAQTLALGRNVIEGNWTGNAIKAMLCNMTMKYNLLEYNYPAINNSYGDRMEVYSGQPMEEIETFLEGRIIDMPGHTDCSISLLLNSGELFCGDAASGSKMHVSTWIKDLDSYCSSWNKMIFLKPRIIYPGHGHPFMASQLHKNLAKVQSIKLHKIKD